MNDAVKVLRTSTFVAPLGLRFWDPVSRRLIGDGLEVTAHPEGPGRPVAAYANRAAIYVVRDLPGLRETEAGAGDADYWAEPPKTREFTIVVRDAERRFLPFQFGVSAPAKGVLGWPCPLISPPDAPPNMVAAAPLFSAPTRDTPAGMAVIRARLRTAAGKPAAWALLEARAGNGPLARGLANRDGDVALLFAYPRPPTSGTRVPLPQQTWNIQLRARYRPADHPPEAPDLCAALDQPEATLWADAGATQPLSRQKLTYGRELTLRTKDGDTWLSEVLIAPT